MPARMSAVLAQRLFVAKGGVPSALLNQIKRLAAFQNPEFYKRQSLRLPTNDVIRALEEGRSPILLTERKDHLDYFVRRFERIARHLVVLQGGMGAKVDRATRAQLEGIPPNEPRLLLATGRYIGEGFDDARLDTLFLALPVAWKGTLVQYTGRLHRLHPGKREVRIFDYVDQHVPVLLHMFEKRLRGYRAIGYARGEAPLGYGEPNEVDEEDLLRVFDHESATHRSEELVEDPGSGQEGDP